MRSILEKILLLLAILAIPLSLVSGIGLPVSSFAIAIAGVMLFFSATTLPSCRRCSSKHQYLHHWYCKSVDRLFRIITFSFARTHSLWTLRCRSG